MARMVKVAVVQMDVSPAPVANRLERAGCLVSQAAQEGAQLVVLPELFNTGYAYEDANYTRAETLSGQTVTWMKHTAARLGVLIAGSLLLLEQPDIYNALLLIAPDGRLWRYDKNHPFAWERAYFRAGRRITVAQTELGDFGLMICADVTRPSLWKSYAGQVDMMVICSSPPDVGRPTYHFPSGAKITSDDMGPFMASIKDVASLSFGAMLSRNAAWLGVPVVNTVASGSFRSAIPNGRAALLSVLPMAPWLAKHLPEADRMEMSAQMTQGTKIINAAGQVLAEIPQDGMPASEAFTLAEVTLPEHKPQPAGPPPSSLLLGLAALFTDLPALQSVPLYRRNLRRFYGPHMAPIDPVYRRRLGLGMMVGALLLAMWLRRRGQR